MRRGILVLSGIVLVWAIGLIVFIRTLPQPIGEAPAPADGVVVFTGAGTRITAGMDLLSSGAGARLLISGVNPEINRASIEAMWTGEAALFECCVDLGLEARSTEGNAYEVRDWALTYGFSRLILVTSDYHMPRALRETRTSLANVEIAPYPVASGLRSAQGRPTSLTAARKLAVEYTKFLAVCVKTFVTPRSR